MVINRNEMTIFFIKLLLVAIRKAIISTIKLKILLRSLMNVTGVVVDYFKLAIR